MKRKRSKVTYTQLLEGEVMKEIEGYPLYFVTNYGRLLSTKPLGNSQKKKTPSQLREITLSFGTERYYYGNIYNLYGNRTSIRLHRLVWQYHNPNGEHFKEGFVIDHIDGDKTNNHISNLRQITQQANLLHYRQSKKGKTNE
jgi:hypothetical protein